MDINFNINSIEKSLEINYINNLIKACEKSGLNKNDLEKKLSELSEQSEMKSSGIKKSISNVSLNNTESPTSQQFSDDYLYLKPWAKLTPIHKIIKIKEYVNMLLIKNEEEKESLKHNSHSHYNKNHNKTQKGGNNKLKKRSTVKRRKWSLKYKRSINCNRPKGFSQKQYCKYGRNKK